MSTTSQELPSTGAVNPDAELALEPRARAPLYQGPGFPPREQLDALYAKALAEADEHEARIVNGRMERLGIKFDADHDTD